MPNISRGNVAVQWFATRHERVKPKAAPIVTTRQPKHSIVNVWTPEQDNILRKCYRADGPEVLGERFGRSPSAVQCRAHVLGITA